MYKTPALGVQITEISDETSEGKGMTRL